MPRQPKLKVRGLPHTFPRHLRAAATMHNPSARKSPRSLVELLTAGSDLECVWPSGQVFPGANGRQDGSAATNHQNKTPWDPSLETFSSRRLVWKTWEMVTACLIHSSHCIFH